MLTLMAAAQMATRTEGPHSATTLPTDGPRDSMGSRIIPVSAPTITMSAPASSEPMEIASPPNSSGNGQSHGRDESSSLRQETERGRSHDREQDKSSAPEQESNGKTNERSKNSSPSEHGSASNMPAPPPAAAAVHQPKIVQTAFIHKLYK
jgi:hypothetical protein